MSKLKRLGGIAVGIAIAIGIKVYDKSSTHDDMKVKLVKLCETDEPCVAAVDQHFDTCFDDNYDSGGRRQAGGVEMDAFLACFNQQAGAEHFAVNMAH